MVASAAGPVEPNIMVPELWLKVVGPYIQNLGVERPLYLSSGIGVLGCEGWPVVIRRV